MYRDGYIIPCLKNFFYWHFKILNNSEVATYNEIIKVAITLHREKEDAYMAENKKIYITANELAEMLGVSVGHAYKLIRKLNQELEKELIMHQPVSLPEEPQIEQIDRITVKDGSKIHLIKTDELIYIQACGDYVMLITPSGEYLKEQTMKYFETHLPSDTFVRVHRSTIVNVTQISRVELFGKETYQLLLKNGVKLRVSLSGYRLLKERLGL